MFARHLGCGVGHLELCARSVEHILYDGFDPNTAVVPDEPAGQADLPELQEDEVPEEEQVPAADDAEGEIGVDGVDELYADL